MNQLEVLRESLGQCDEIILDALLMRNRIVEDIMVYKEANNVPILQPEQEAKQKEWLERRMQEKRHKNEVADVFESITRNSKKIQARKLFNYNIVLIGFMGAGKSTISEFLKTAFAMDVIEMDQIIAERAGMSISDIFETYGEQYFRDCETNLLIEMQSRTNVVISCGGGTPMRECNVAEMKKNGRRRHRVADGPGPAGQTADADPQSQIGLHLQRNHDAPPVPVGSRHVDALLL